MVTSILFSQFLSISTSVTFLLSYLFFFISLDGDHLLDFSANVLQRCFLILGDFVETYFWFGCLMQRDDWWIDDLAWRRKYNWFSFVHNISRKVLRRRRSIGQENNNKNTEEKNWTWFWGANISLLSHWISIYRVMRNETVRQRDWMINE